MTDNEKIGLIVEALTDNSKGLLTDAVFVFVVHNIIHGVGKITEEDIAWGRKAIKDHAEEYEDV